LTGAARIAVVGDRPDSDLAGGAARGWTTILVLTGVTGSDEWQEADPRPDYVIDSVASLAPD
jgi:ribonucleotide monophosphatase NagD (HAD superfamily)